jgi:hypothetical protein
MVDMDDSFGFGEPAPRRGHVDERPPPTPTSRSRGIRGGTVLIALVAVLVVAGIVAVLSVMRAGGETVADAQRTAVGQIDAANDVQAETTLRQAVVAARSLIAQAEGDATSPGFEAASPEALAAFEPSFAYTTQASTSPSVVSVAATPSSWSAAAASVSGTCLWIRLDADGATSYGSGSPCSGQAAASASAAAW